MEIYHEHTPSVVNFCVLTINQMWQNCETITLITVEIGLVGTKNVSSCRALPCVAKYVVTTTL
jgi:hypothetical protein